MAQLPSTLDTSLSAGHAGVSVAIAAPPAGALLIALSLAAHAIGAVALGYLPATADRTGPRFEEVAVTLMRPPPPVIEPVEPEPVVLAEPELPVLAPRAIDRTTPSTPEVIPDVPPVIEPTPAPVTAAPPSVDDIFGDPPPLAAVLTAEGTGGAHTVASGSGSAPGGRAGGSGTTVGAGGGAGSEPSIDDAAARRRARMAYKRELERILRARSAYPRAALRDHLEGRVELALRIGADGSVLAVRVVRGSTYSLLDNAAIDSARADRLPAPPAAAALSPSDEITVALVYVVR
jgi:protein TonB